MEALDAGFDGVCFIGYHCRSNTHGIMAHTIWGGMIRSIAVDGKEMGEGGINATHLPGDPFAVCGHRKRNLFWLPPGCGFCELVTERKQEI